eukprot:11117708-Karenia_brevis.AAC.1
MSNSGNRIAKHLATAFVMRKCATRILKHNFLSSNLPQTAEERDQLHHRLSEEDDGKSMVPGELADLNDA